MEVSLWPRAPPIGAQRAPTSAQFAALPRPSRQGRFCGQPPAPVPGCSATYLYLCTINIKAFKLLQIRIYHSYLQTGPYRSSLAFNLVRASRAASFYLYIQSTGNTHILLYTDAEPEPLLPRATRPFVGSQDGATLP